MSHAARAPEEEPAPERASLDARAAALLDGHAALIASARTLMARCPDPQPALLRQLVTETISAGLHLEELRGQMHAYQKLNGSLEVAFQAGRDYEQAQAAKAAVPGPRHARGPARYRPGEGQRALFSVKTIPGIAVAAIVAVKTLGRAHRLAAALAAVTIPFAAGAGTYAALQPGVTSTASPPAASAPVPGWHTSATPVPSQSLAALTRPKPKHAGKGKTLLAAGGLLPVYSTAPQAAPSSAPSSAAPAVSVAVGPAQLSVSAATLDLSLVPQATFTVTASGAGWASWHVSTSGTDLAFSPSSGVLQAGQSVTVTVSLASALDGLAQQSFSIAGQTIAVTLPLPVPLPSPTDVVPTDVLPSGVLPSGT